MIRMISTWRALHPANEIESVILDFPDLSMVTLTSTVSKGRQTSVLLFEGSEASLSALRRRYIEAKPAALEQIELLEVRRGRLLVYEVEQSGINPLDLSPLVERHLGPQTLFRLRKNVGGVTWELLPFHQAHIQRFLAALKKHAGSSAPLPGGASDLRFTIKAGSDFFRSQPAQLALRPRESAALNTAADMGYFERPRKVTIVGVAEKLALPRSTAHLLLQEAVHKVVRASIQDERASGGGRTATS